jgi:hypothetical protein
VSFIVRLTKRMKNIVVISAFIILILTLSGCCGPMECKPAKVGFNVYEPIIGALEKYKSENNSYPDSLHDLVPKYIAKIPDSPNPPRPSNIEYKKDKENYFLKFTYGGPGMNICKYDSIEKHWLCSGFY